MSNWTLLHTADWHLGHTLHGHARTAEHAAFLAWLRQTVVEREVDVLLVAGDVFDARTPPASAQAQLFSFVADVHAARPSLEIVLVAGNHDSPSRLTAPRPLLEPLGARVVGAAVPGAPAGDLALPLRRRGELLGVLAAVPYLRAADLAGVGDGLDAARLGAATASLHAEVGRAARGVAGREPVVGVGHGEIRGAVLSPRSERPVAGGGPSALEGDVLCPEARYVALGHLHFPQWVGRDRRVRYAGSPFPLALDEASYPHGVSLASFGAGDVRVEALEVPRSVEIVRVPAEGAAPLDAALDALSRLPTSDAPPERWPFVEVHVRLDAPERSLRARVESALEGRAARLTRIVVSEAAAAPRASRVRLADLDVREMVVRKWEAEHGTSPSADVLAALDEAVAAAAAAVGEDEARRRTALSSTGEVG